jgi:ribosomal protein L40E
VQNHLRRFKLVYCTKCGTENSDDAVVCRNCGASLRPIDYKSRRGDWDLEDECFGGRSRTIWPIFIGVFIILVGLSQLLEKIYPWASFDNIWPLFLIALGLIIVYSRLQRP